MQYKYLEEEHWRWQELAPCAGSKPFFRQQTSLSEPHFLNSQTWAVLCIP